MLALVCHSLEETNRLDGRNESLLGCPHIIVPSTMQSRNFLLLLCFKAKFMQYDICLR